MPCGGTYVYGAERQRHFHLMPLGANPDAYLYLDLQQKTLLLLTNTSPSRAALTTLVPLLLDRLHELVQLPYLLVLARRTSAHSTSRDTYLLHQ